MGKTAFISYASADEAIANEISSALEGRGVACWIAPRDVRLGADYGAEIIDGIESSAVFVLVLSEHANASTYVKREVERAVAKGKPIFPMRVADVLPSKSLELFVSSTEWIDAWKPPLEPHVQRLADSIRAVAATGTALPADALLHRRSSARDGSAAAEASRITRPRLVAVIAALCIALLALGVLLATNLRRSPAVPATPDVAAAPAPTSPTPAAVAPSRTATPVAPTGLAAGSETDPCPQRLSINRELPTPFGCVCSALSTRDGTVWGSDAYTDDSALCRAALHAGVVTPQGGPIRVTRRAGLELYVGSTRHGVASSDYGSYPSQIAFEGAPAPPPGPGPCPQRLSVNRALATPYTCRCSAQATREGTVWGTDLYTDDSALCAAARHAGRVGADGGAVTVLRSAGRALYVGSARGGVQSHDYGAYDASIAFR